MRACVAEYYSIHMNVCTLHIMCLPVGDVFCSLKDLFTGTVLTGWDPYLSKGRTCTVHQGFMYVGILC